MEQELLTIIEHLRKLSVFSEVCVSKKSFKIQNRSSELVNRIKGNTMVKEKGQKKTTTTNKQKKKKESKKQNKKQNQKQPYNENIIYIT